MENHAAIVKIEAGLEHDRNITRQDISDALLAGPYRHNVCSPVPACSHSLSSRRRSTAR